MALRTHTALTAIATIGLFLAAPASASTASASTAECKTDLTVAQSENQEAMAFDKALVAVAAASKNTEAASALASAAISCLGQKVAVTKNIAMSVVSTGKALSNNEMGFCAPAYWKEVEVDKLLTGAIRSVS